MPVITLQDGTQFGQARSILRFIGKHSGLYPEDPLEALKVDSLMDALDEFQTITNSVGQGLPQEEKEAAVSTFTRSSSYARLLRPAALSPDIFTSNPQRLAACSDGGKIATRLTQLEAFIASNGENGFAVGNALTIADLQMFSTTGYAPIETHLSPPPPPHTAAPYTAARPNRRRRRRP